MRRLEFFWLIIIVRELVKKVRTKIRSELCFEV